MMNPKLYLLLLLIGFSIHSQAQIEPYNPFAKYGYTPKIVTLSNGKYQEFHDLDTIVRIGTVLFDTIEEKIVGYVDPHDTLMPPTGISSRWFSVDPLAHEFASVSPYNFVLNNPIRLIDPDGRAPVDSVYVVYNGKAHVINKEGKGKVSSRIGYSTLRRIPDGKELLDKYYASKKTDIYIGLADLYYGDGFTLTGTDFIKDGKLDVEAIKDKMKGKHVLIQEGYRGMLEAMRGVELVSDKPSKDVFFMVFKNDERSGYQKAKVLFHEAKAHVDYVLFYRFLFGKDPTGDQQHKFIGVRTSNSAEIEDKNGIQATMEKKIDKLEQKDKLKKADE